MSRSLYVEKAQCDEAIAEAARKQTPLVLTRRSPSGWAVAKSRFHGCCERDQQLFIEHPPELDSRAWPQPAAGELLGVAFRRGHKKCLFNTVVMDAGASVGQAAPGMAVRWPSELQELQRRVYQRACPPPGRRIEVCVGSASAGPGQATVLCGMLEDLSAGGMRVCCKGEPPLKLGQGAHLTFALDGRTAEVTVDATFRHCQAAGERCWLLGFQFAGLETARPGQELLARIARTVTDFQRAAGRRQQPGLHRRRNPQ